MACKEDRFTCGDRTYVIRQMPPRLAVPVQVYLAKTLGQPLFKAFSANGFQAEDALAVAIGLFTERLEDEGLMKVMQSVFTYVGILDDCIRICASKDDGSGIDEKFTGRNKELWQVFIKALQVNFADFFVGALSPSSLLARLRAAGTPPGSSTSTSTSGDPVTPPQHSAETSNT